jgi:hypothetical protein
MTESPKKIRRLLDSRTATDLDFRTMGKKINWQTSHPMKEEQTITNPMERRGLTPYRVNSQ